VNERDILKVVYKCIPTQLANGLWQPCVIPETYYADGSLATIDPVMVYRYALSIEFFSEDEAFDFGKGHIEREYGEDMTEWNY